MGQPFGDGKDGAYSSATIPTLVYKSCTGTADSTTLSADTDASPFAVGDVLLLHQTRGGANVGKWEINRVSAVGSDQYTMQVALKYTYTSPAQAIKIPRYTNVTVESGTWTLTDWDGTTGGILTFATNGTVTVTGSIIGTSKGFNGGAANAQQGSNNPIPGLQGEGTAGAGGSASTSANGNGGGGGVGGNPAYAGGSGGNGEAGIGGTGSAGGSQVGSADLITADFGGGGGSGGGYDNLIAGAGGDGGGMVFIFAKNVSGGTITFTGGDGTGVANTAGAGGGGGAGGSILIVCQTASLGFATTALGGAGGNSTVREDGASGAVGRIAVHHLSTVTGTTNPAFEDVTDTSLRESGMLQII